MNSLFASGARSGVPALQWAPAGRVAGWMVALAFIASPGMAQVPQVVYGGLRDIVIPADMDGVYIDLGTGQSSTSEPVTWDINPFYGGYAIANADRFQPVRLTSDVESVVLRLDPGTSVGPTGVYASAAAGSVGHLGSGADQFSPGQEGYLGFQWTPAPGQGPYYGWMRVVLTANGVGGLIRDWAYRTDGTPIAVGEMPVPVPEPSQGAVFVLLAAGSWTVLRRWK